MKKNLSKEYKEIMAEAKKLVLASAINDSAFDSDEDDFIANAKAMRLVIRLIDLYGDMLERQDELMDKIDKCLNR